MAAIPPEQRVRERAVLALVGGGGERRDRRHHEHGAEPLDARPADQQDGEVRAQRRRERPDAVDRQPDRERAVGAQDVAELRAEQHERRHHQRVQRDRGLHALDRRVEVLDDLRDRHVHHARVEHHDELGRGQDEHREPLAHARPTLPGLRHLGGHATATPRCCIEARGTLPVLVASSAPYRALRHSLSVGLECSWQETRSAGVGCCADCEAALDEREQRRRESACAWTVPSVRFAPCQSSFATRLRR